MVRGNKAKTKRMDFKNRFPLLFFGLRFQKPDIILESEVTLKTFSDPNFIKTVTFLKIKPVTFVLFSQKLNLL